MSIICNIFKVTAVVVGLDRYVNYYKLCAAFCYIKSQKCAFIATNRDLTFPADGRTLIGICIIWNVIQKRERESETTTYSTLSCEKYNSSSKQFQHFNTLLVYKKSNLKGGGSIVASVAASSGVEPITTGKPEKWMLEALIDVYVCISCFLSLFFSFL